MLIGIAEGCVEALCVCSNAKSDKRSYLPFGYLQIGVLWLTSAHVMHLWSMLQAEQHLP